MRKNVEYNLFGQKAIYYKGKNRSCRGNASKSNKFKIIRGFIKRPREVYVNGLQKVKISNGDGHT
jgi:hypothetical protein